MSDFKAKMHKNSNSAGAPPLNLLGSLHHSPDSLVVFKGPTSKEREGRGRGGKGRGGEGREGESQSPPKYFGLEPPLSLLPAGPTAANLQQRCAATGCGQCQ